MILLLLCVFGLLLGGQLNRAIYEWAWNRRQISPWSAPPENVAKRSWSDCIPVVGWWTLRRERDVHGRGFWLRPMLIELTCAAGLPALYWWEVLGDRTLVWVWAAHAVLFALMMVATFIDIDEKTIPDFITIPGTLIALLFAIVSQSQSLLPTIVPPAISPVLLTTPAAINWPPILDTQQGLWFALVCWFGWCYGLLPKTIYFRRGLIKGCRYLVASIVRHPWSARIAGMGIVGAIVITFVWSRGGTSWQGLLSSLAGLALGGGLVWAIRIVSGYVLGVEAMGFGDVTLMAMIGAFLGWQAALMVFALAPFTSLLIAVSRLIITGKQDIPFGPFLCAAAAIVIIEWQTFWLRWGPLFEFGIWIPGMIVVCVGVLGVMLFVLQIFKRILGFV